MRGNRFPRTSMLQRYHVPFDMYCNRRHICAPSLRGPRRIETESCKIPCTLHDRSPLDMYWHIDAKRSLSLHSALRRMTPYQLVQWTMSMVLWPVLRREHLPRFSKRLFILIVRAAPLTLCFLRKCPESSTFAMPRWWQVSLESCRLWEWKQQRKKKRILGYLSRLQSQTLYILIIINSFIFLSLNCLQYPKKKYLKFLVAICYVKKWHK